MKPVLVALLFCIPIVIGCDGGITIDGTVYTYSMSSAADSSKVAIGSNMLSDTRYQPLAGVKVIVSNRPFTDEQMVDVANDTTFLYPVKSDSGGVFHYHETSYPGSESLTILFVKKGYKPVIGSFSKNKAFLDESISAVLVIDTIVH